MSIFFVAYPNNFASQSIGEKSLSAKQREAAQKQEKCAQLQNKIDVSHKHVRDPFILLAEN